MDDVLAGYAAASAALVSRFEAIRSAELFAPVRDLLPTNCVRVADIGAGTGRDAAWFAAQGHHVLAVEPVAELREAGILLHRNENISWLDDRLPDLGVARDLPPFELLTLCAVWQHLDQDQHCHAMRNLSAMSARGGLLIMSLRHGPGAPDRRVVPILVEDVVSLAKDHGFTLLREAEASSLQPANRAAGVHWTWLVLRNGRQRRPRNKRGARHP